jgi:hypothetical protein
MSSNELIVVLAALAVAGFVVAMLARSNATLTETLSKVAIMTQVPTFVLKEDGNLMYESTPVVDGRDRVVTSKSAEPPLQPVDPFDEPEAVGDERVP